MPICSFCSSMRDFAFSFLQIPHRQGHPCCSANGSHYQAHSGLSPPSYCPCRANKNKPRPEAGVRGSCVFYCIVSVVLVELSDHFQRWEECKVFYDLALYFTYLVYIFVICAFINLNRNYILNCPFKEFNCIYIGDRQVIPLPCLYI